MGGGPGTPDRPREPPLFFFFFSIFLKLIFKDFYFILLI
jgi:hypothetical protein